MVWLGIPAGLSIQPWQLKQLTEQKKFDYYEIWGNYVVFHFEQFDAHETRQINLDLKADLVGEYEAPASLAYLYYTNEQRVWDAPTRVRVGDR
jgi:hypothetical protein